MAKRDDMLHHNMETVGALMPVTTDEGDIGESADDGHKVVIGGHQVAMSFVVRQNAQKRGCWLKHIHSTGVLRTLVEGNWDFEIEGECSLVWIAVEGKARKIHSDPSTEIDMGVNFRVVAWITSKICELSEGQIRNLAR